MNNSVTEELRNSLHPDFNFTQWLLQSNNPKVAPYRNTQKYANVDEAFKENLSLLEGESLEEILDILIREPLADYFWYNYPSNGGGLCYSLPHHDVVPSSLAATIASGALRVDKQKIKEFLRDIKIEMVLNEIVI